MNRLVETFEAYQGPDILAAWLGQQSYVFKADGKTLYVDLFLSDKGKRMIPPFFADHEVTNADFFFGTHRHRDHIDEAHWPALAAASPQAKFVIPCYWMDKLPSDLGMDRDRFIAVSDGETVQLTEKLSVTGVASAHELLHQDETTGEYPFMGYVINCDGYTIYAPGDCCPYDGLQAKLIPHALDLALLPINGRDAKRFSSGCIGNFTFQEAADLAGVIKPQLTIPGHWDMFPHNLENPFNFTEYLAAKYPELASRICQEGKTFELSR